jgi:hypothetical protein
MNIVFSAHGNYALGVQPAPVFFTDGERKRFSRSRGPGASAGGKHYTAGSRTGGGRQGRDRTGHLDAAPLAASGIRAQHRSYRSTGAATPTSPRSRPTPVKTGDTVLWAFEDSRRGRFGIRQRQWLKCVHRGWNPMPATAAEGKAAL